MQLASLERAIRRLEQASLAAAGLFVIAMMLIVSVDAVSRYLFRAPLSWAFELINHYLLVAAAYLALAATFQRGYHINIELFHARLPPRWRARATALVSVLAAATFVLLGYATLANLIESFEKNEFYPGVISWPAWVSFLPIPLGAALLVLRLLHHALTLLRAGEDPSVGHDADELELVE